MSTFDSTNTAWHQYTGTPNTAIASLWPQDKKFDLTAQHFNKFVPVNPAGTLTKDGAPADKQPWGGYSSRKPVDADTARGLIASHGINIGALPTVDGNMVAVDADTQDAVDAFSAWMVDTYGYPVVPTVLTPGVYADAGAGSLKAGHTGGAHVWVHTPVSVASLFPEGARIPAVKPGTDGWDVKFGGSYVLAPPSERAEGAYTPVMVDGDLAVLSVPPTWVVDVLIHRGVLDRKDVTITPKTPARPSADPATMRIVRSLLTGGDGEQLWWGSSRQRDEVAGYVRACVAFNYAMQLSLFGGTSPEPNGVVDDDAELQRRLCMILARLRGYAAPGEAMCSVGVSITVTTAGKRHTATYSPLSTAPPNPWAPGGALAAGSPDTATDTDTDTAVDGVADTVSAPAATAVSTVTEDLPEPDPVDDEFADTGYGDCDEFADLIDQWADSTSWDELLTELDSKWEETGVDSCGCPVFRHPTASSDRSGVGHTAGCKTGESQVFNAYSTNVEFDYYRGYNSQNGVIATKFDLLCSIEGTEADAMQVVADTCGVDNPLVADDDDTIPALPGFGGPLEDDAPAPAPAQPQPPTPPTLTVVGGTAVDTAPTQPQAPVQSPTPTTPSVQPQAPAHAQDTAVDPFTVIRTYYPAAQVVQQKGGRFLVFPPDDVNYQHTPLSADAAATVADVITMMRDCGVTVSQDTVRGVAESARAGGLSGVSDELWPEGYPASPEHVRRIMDFSDYTRWVYYNCVTAQGGITANPVVSYVDALVRASALVPCTIHIPTGGENAVVPVAFYHVAAGPSGCGKSVATDGRGWAWTGDGRLPVINDGFDLLDVTVSQDEVMRRRGIVRLANPVVVTPQDQRGEPTMPTVQRTPVGGFAHVPEVYQSLDDYQFTANSGEAIGARLSRAWLAKRYPPATNDTDDDDTTVQTPQWVASDAVPNAVALLNEPELARFVAVSGRSGNTVSPVLLSAFVGEPIGADTKTEQWSLTGRYAVAMRGGTQPTVYAALRDQADGNGLVQRILFTCAEWPLGRADIGVQPPPQDVVAGTQAFKYPGYVWTQASPLTGFTMCPRAMQDVRLKRFNGRIDDGWDPGEGAHLYDHGLPEDQAPLFEHGTLIAVKLACAVAVLHGTSHINEAIWDHVGDLMSYYRRTLVGLEAQAAMQDAKRAQAVGRRRHQIAAGEDAARSETNKQRSKAVRRLRDVFTDPANAGRVFTRRDLRGRCSTSYRPQFDNALDLLLRRKEILGSAAENKYWLNPNPPAQKDTA
ncbi:hypothetical protein HMPREF3048_10565 [Corynebacterium sp. HMSC075D04]|uniref:DUF3987 domain-containing protein n=1 Tax=Corynebacterium sp. HMSC075D04 TaxID=1739540 RepID=UPI0008A4CF2B|nr:DUF3987 domain-containing protein [Corynebacterium sp. HMSC075D04]OFO33579.1 hypothetical protein HMPREF3048_10565 [Corynebacterium sp. HMSC075D04]